ncbi:MAG: hydrogenase expression/formation protein HypE [Candidatus Moranbacteria bacterium]|jgi:hydrogenase expression/formation protein HypE|nr:hydrogenase expression/formation protein HypE [Candidatus Moranbacteria bacterium]
MTIKQYSNITLDMGGGGLKSAEIISNIRKNFPKSSKWKNIEDDGASFELGDSSIELGTDFFAKKLVFTTDAFIVDPIFFPGGDIGKIAICGTINDLAVMGAKPIGISLSLVIEEGFSAEDLKKIMQSIGAVSKKTGVPVVTGDTKVTEKGKIDKIAITTAGVGLAQKIIPNSGAKAGDLIISSGDLGEHAVTLLAQRFNYQTKIRSDCQPLNKELETVGKFLNACKDPTRGGLAANLNEIADKSKVKIILEEKSLPYKKEVVAVTELLGLDKFSLASEGRFIASVSEKNIDKVIKILRKFNREAGVIGKVDKGRGVFVRTELGSLRKIESPRGKLIPRIC